MYGSCHCCTYLPLCSLCAQCLSKTCSEDQWRSALVKEELFRKHLKHTTRPLFSPLVARFGTAPQVKSPKRWEFSATLIPALDVLYSNSGVWAGPEGPDGCRKALGTGQSEARGTGRPLSALCAGGSQPRGNLPVIRPRPHAKPDRLSSPHREYGQTKLSRPPWLSLPLLSYNEQQSEEATAECVTHLHT